MFTSSLSPSLFLLYVVCPELSSGLSLHVGALAFYGVGGGGGGEYGDQLWRPCGFKDSVCPGHRQQECERVQQQAQQAQQATFIKTGDRVGGQSGGSKDDFKGYLHCN